jgi:hypothetical protein
VAVTWQCGDDIDDDIAEPRRVTPGQLMLSRGIDAHAHEKHCCAEARVAFDAAAVPGQYNAAAPGTQAQVARYT